MFICSRSLNIFFFLEHRADRKSMMQKEGQICGRKCLLFFLCSSIRNRVVACLSSPQKFFVCLGFPGSDHEAGNVLDAAAEGAVGGADDADDAAAAVVVAAGINGGSAAGCGLAAGGSRDRCCGDEDAGGSIRHLGGYRSWP